MLPFFITATKRMQIRPAWRDTIIINFPLSILHCFAAQPQKALPAGTCGKANADSAWEDIFAPNGWG